MQIRFVNNEGHPPTKRRRINAACRTCRKRKTRCDGKRPLCSTCTENGHECLGYADVGESRKESDASEANRNEDEDIDDEDESKSARDLGAKTDNGGPGFANVSPDPYRVTSQSYSNVNPPNYRRRHMDNIEGQGKGSSLADYRDVPVFSDDDPSPTDTITGHPEMPMKLAANSSGRPQQLQTESHRVPYFRYFGPTAIVPGFKQMVVSVRESRRSTGAASASGTSPGSGSHGGGGSIYGGTPQPGIEARPSVEMPIYYQSDPLPVNRLIVHLVETFFVHLGCNFPFLKQDRFVSLVENKKVEAILVDSICALAARFSDHQVLTASHDPTYAKSEYGHVFAQRAKAAIVDTFPCPTVAAVQSCLLLAYEGFGSNQDSALWMYLGCAIRMAVDLGLQKLDGVRHQGQKDPGYHRSSIEIAPDRTITVSAEEKKEIEQERIDTLWAVFMLDRVISSGTGRPVTLRDEDFELTFPAVTTNCESGWPNPFPALIQVVHLYGRVSDLLNNIKNVHDVTPKTIEGLSGLEKELTQLYQRLDERLTFNAPNFQHYVKSGEGTNFILVHFWFHTLIMLLHQPTLMHSFEGQIQQLLPNSRELSMSSAKTIADILAFAELIDPRSFIGNPFTSQPMYIAACAFLKETAAHTSSQPTSRDASPPRKPGGKGVKPQETDVNGKRVINHKQKHSLLASAANQNYKRCYKALQQLETYWAGTRYILVALDQKASGVWDPETYTAVEMEEATKGNHEIAPSWERRLSMNASSPGNLGDFVRSPRMADNLPGTPAIDHSQAIGWSLTGTTYSPSSNLTFMYQSMNSGRPQPSAPSNAGNMVYDPIRQSVPESTLGSTSTSNLDIRHQSYLQARQQSRSMAPPAPKFSSISPDPATMSEAEMLLELQGSPFPRSPRGSRSSFDQSQIMTRPDTLSNSFDFGENGGASILPTSPSGYMGLGGVGDMWMQSQEIDMSSLGGDMMPWLEYLPQDVLSIFDGGSAAETAAASSLNDGSVDLGNLDTSGA